MGRCVDNFLSSLCHCSKTVVAYRQSLGYRPNVCPTFFNLGFCPDRWRPADGSQGGVGASGPPGAQRPERRELARIARMAAGDHGSWGLAGREWIGRTFAEGKATLVFGCCPARACDREPDSGVVGRSFAGISPGSVGRFLALRATVGRIGSRLIMRAGFFPVSGNWVDLFVDRLGRSNVYAGGWRCLMHVREPRARQNEANLEKTYCKTQRQEIIAASHLTRVEIRVSS